VAAPGIGFHFTVAERAAVGQLRVVVVCYLGHDPADGGGLDPAWLLAGRGSTTLRSAWTRAHHLVVSTP
jgi:hypothetical protein